jgi:hypothetical protein
LAVQASGAKHLGERLGLGDGSWDDGLAVGSSGRKAVMKTVRIEKVH